MQSIQSIIIIILFFFSSSPRHLSSLGFLSAFAGFFPTYVGLLSACLGCLLVCVCARACGLFLRSQPTWGTKTKKHRLEQVSLLPIELESRNSFPWSLKQVQHNVGCVQLYTLKLQPQTSLHSLVFVKLSMGCVTQPYPRNQLRIRFRPSYKTLKTLLDLIFTEVSP